MHARVIFYAALKGNVFAVWGAYFNHIFMQKKNLPMDEKKSMILIEIQRNTATSTMWDF